MPEGMPGKVPEDLPDRIPDRMSEDMPEDMPDRVPENMPGRMPEDMPEDMPDKMPEDMSDRMLEDLPVTKRIDVMAGITRSKVFIFFGILNYAKPFFVCENANPYPYDFGPLLNLNLSWSS